MADAWVLDASPVIALAKIGRLDLLALPGRRLVVPQAVADEILAGPDDPARKALDAGFGQPFAPAAVESDILEWVLGSGESAVLSLARRLPGLAVLDDRDARRVARLLGVRLTRTLGIILAAARAARVASASEVLRRLREEGVYLSDGTVTEALRRHLGESWEP